jgi:hypothetical protein
MHMTSENFLSIDIMYFLVTDAHWIHELRD